MKTTHDPCPYELAHRVQFKGIAEDLVELKDRVHRLETTLARGVTLLVANLVGVTLMLAQQLITRL